MGTNPVLSPHSKNHECLITGKGGNLTSNAGKMPELAKVLSINLDGYWDPQAPIKECL